MNAVLLEKQQELLSRVEQQPLGLPPPPPLSQTPASSPLAGRGGRQLIKLPSRKSATLLCGIGDSSSRRRRMMNFAKLIGRRLWQESSSITAKSTSLRLLYL
jgi:hypothetical protein